jgi:hypothetical protein
LKESKQKFVVDYDLPRRNQCARSFYRSIKKTVGDKGEKSSRSVYIVEDLAVANEIYRKAKACGIAHIHRLK